MRTGLGCLLESALASTPRTLKRQTEFAMSEASKTNVSVLGRSSFVLSETLTEAMPEAFNSGQSKIRSKKGRTTTSDNVCYVQLEICVLIWWIELFSVVLVLDRSGIPRGFVS